MRASVENARLTAQLEFPPADLLAFGVGRSVERVVVLSGHCDNSRAGRPFRIVTTFEHGSVVGKLDWPRWTPEAIRGAGR